jgi:hypothetical protein
VLSGKKYLNETKNHNPPLQVKWLVPKKMEKIQERAVKMTIQFGNQCHILQTKNIYHLMLFYTLLKTYLKMISSMNVYRAVKILRLLYHLTYFDIHYFYFPMSRLWKIGSSCVPLRPQETHHRIICTSPPVLTVTCFYYLEKSQFAVIIFLFYTRFMQFWHSEVHHRVERLSNLHIFAD